MPDLCELAQERLHERIGRARGIEHEGAIVRKAVAVDVARDERSVRNSRAERAIPTHTHEIERVVRERVDELMARINKHNIHKVVIHTIAFDNDAGGGVLQEIAKQNGGTYRFVR